MRDVAAFVRAVWHDWVARMSGIASIILAALPSFIDLPGWAVWLAAAACLLVAAFRVWRNERVSNRKALHVVNGWIEGGNELVRKINTLGTNALNTPVVGVSLEDELRRIGCDLR